MITTGISGIRIKISDIISLAIVVLALAVYVGSDSMGTIELGAAVLIFLFGFNRWEMKKAIPVFVLTLFVMVLLVTSGQMGARGFNAPIKHALKFVHLLFAFLCYLFLKNLSDERWKKIFVLAVFAGSLASCLRSIYLVITGNDYAIRYASRYGYNNEGVAGFSQIYGIPFLIVITAFLFILIARESIKTAVALLVVLAVYLYFIAVSLMVTALILTVVGIFLLLVLKLIRRSPALVLSLIVVVILALLLVIVLFPETVMDLAKKATANMNYVTRSRLLYVTEQILGVPSGIKYTYTRRNELASYSINTFLEHPMFGVGYAGYGYGVIGCHQEWYDMLGVFGLIGSTVVWGIIAWMLVTVFKGIESRIEKEMFLVLVVMFGVLGFLNPCMGAPLLMAMFVVAPNARYLFGTGTREKVFRRKEQPLAEFGK